jgi:hypothetical protein
VDGKDVRAVATEVYKPLGVAELEKRLESIARAIVRTFGYY